MVSPLPPFERIFRENLPFVWRVLRSLGVPPADLDDLCQEVFVVAHRRLDTFEGRSTLTSWLYGICWRVWSDHRKKAHRQRERLTDAPPEVPAEATQARAAEHRQEVDLLHRILMELSEEHRAVFVMYEIEQLTMKEIASAMECPLQTGYTRLRAARAHVQREWARYQGEGRHE